MIRIDKKFAEKWPSTYALRGLIAVGIIFLGCYVAATPDKLPRWALITLLAAAIVLLILPIISWFFEAVFPRLIAISNFIRNIYRRVIYKPYVWLVKLIIKPAVLDITSRTNQEIAVGREQIFEGVEDTESEKIYNILDVERLKLSFKPENDYWRFGFRLSGSNLFPDGRLVPGVALFHFFKDKDSKDLQCIYYNHNGRENARQVLKSNYENEEIEVHLDKKGGLRIVAKIGRDEIYSGKFDLDSHKFIKIRAWSDHRWLYRIAVKF